jgi:hypothetical protein
VHINECKLNHATYGPCAHHWQCCTAYFIQLRLPEDVCICCADHAAYQYLAKVYSTAHAFMSRSSSFKDGETAKLLFVSQLHTDWCAPFQPMQSYTLPLRKVRITRRIVLMYVTLVPVRRMLTAFKPALQALPAFGGK